MSERKQSFSRFESLKKPGSIRRVLNKGQVLKSGQFKVYILKQTESLAHNRAAFIVDRRLYSKKQTLRNRCRRILKEAYRKTKHLISPGHDIVVVATRLNKKIKSTDIEGGLKHVFEKLNKERYQILS